MIRLLRRHGHVTNQTIPWSREAFLQIKPRRRFTFIDRELTMPWLAAEIEFNAGPAVIFRNERDGPWAAVGLFDLGRARAKTAEVWTVQSRAMYRNLGYFNRECLDCLNFYSERHGYKILQCHVRASWQTSRTWVEGFGFEQVGFTVSYNMPEMLIEYQWRPTSGR